MADPAIYVIPDEYYGGAIPKKSAAKTEASSGMAVSAPAFPSRRISPKLFFFGAVGLLFLMVVGGAIWYFTRGLRPLAPAPSVATAPVKEELVPPITESAPPASEETPVSTEAAAPAPGLASLSSDTDSDGLSEIEETLYGGQTTIPDTDGDGFLDGHEVVNLYNPSGIAPERLEAAGFVTRFAHATYAYEVLYPKGWPTLPASSARDISFQSATGESIAIAVVDNPEGLTLRDFARQSAPDARISDWTANKASVDGILLEESGQLRVMFSAKGLIYVFGYVLPSDSGAAYRRTLEMMANSLRIRN